MLEALCNGPPLFRSGTLALLKSQQGDVSRVSGKAEGLLFSLMLWQNTQLKPGN